MAPRVPDEYFRKRASESDDVGVVAPTPAVTEPPSPEEPQQTPAAQGGMAPRLVVLVLVLAVALAFVVGRVVIFTPEPPPVLPSPATPAPTPSATENFAPYDGDVVTVQPVAAQGLCFGEDTGGTADALVDDLPDTIWRCKGDGVGQSITFSFDPRASLVGVRLINGNTSWAGRYPAERRLLSVRWLFSDGSFFVQGLAANNRGYQEVRFPPTEADSVTLTVEASTEPGQPGEMVDAVSITSLEFLTPA